MFAPSSSGKSLDDWSLGSGESARNLSRISSNATPNQSESRGRGDGGQSIITTSGVSRSAILPSAQVDLSSLRRPTTGLARVDRASTLSSSSMKSNMPIVESMAYHQANIQTKIDDITKEMERLRTETEMADVHSEPRMALESRHDALLNTVRGLEGNVADYNLAKEHVRSGSSPGDVKKSTLAIISTNKKMEKEIDAIFIKRNKVHDEISRVEAEVAEIHAVMESKILDGDDELREDLRDVLSTVKAVIAETEQHEDDIVLIRHKLRAMELGEQGYSSQCVKEKKRVERIKEQLEQVDEDIKLAQLPDDEARERLLRKIVGLRLSTKELEEESSLLENELKTHNLVQETTRAEKLMGGSEKAYKRLLKKDNLCKQHLEQLREITRQLGDERCLLLSTVKTLRDDVSKKEEWILNVKLPSKEEMELMKNDVAFTKKHLDVNRETIAILHQEKKKRTNEVCKLGTLSRVLVLEFIQENITPQSLLMSTMHNPKLAQVESLGHKIISEIDEIHKQTAVFVKEIDKFSKLGELQDSARTLRIHLVDMNDMQKRGIQILDSLLCESSSSPQQTMDLRKSSEWKELQDLKSKLCIRAQDLLKLQESRTDHGSVKAECLRLMDKINRGIISNLN